MIRRHIALALLLVCSLLFAEGPADPSSTTYDFGTAKQGTKVLHAFEIANDGTSPLTIKGVELSMPGMTARFRPVISPGSRVHITVEWDTTHLTGEIEGQGLVRFADDSRIPIQILLKGVVKPPLEILPFPAIFLSSFQGENNERRLSIINNQDEPLTVTLQASDSKRLRASLVVVQPGHTYELVVTTTAGTLPGRYDEELSISTDNPVIGTVKIPVHLFVKPDLYVNPEALDFGQVSADQLRNDPRSRSFLTQTFLVKKRAGNFEIRRISSDLPGIEIIQDPINQQSSTYRIDVALNPEKIKPGKLEGLLEIDTNDQAFPRIEVPVKGYVF